MQVPRWSLVTICLSCIVFQASTCLAQSNPATIFEIKALPNGVRQYTDRAMGISFKLGRDWRVGDSGRWRDFGWRGKFGVIGYLATTTWLWHHGTHEEVGLYYRVFKRSDITREEIQKLLLADVDDKIFQRRENDEWRDYRVRPRSYEEGEIHGWPALAWVADYTIGKHEMVEYLIWVRSKTTLAQFFIQCPADELDQVRERVRPIIQSLTIR